MAITSNRWAPRRSYPPYVNTPWHELAHLYARANYRFRVAKRRSSATKLLLQLQELTTRLAAENDDALVISASRALLAEARGDLPAAVHATERLVRDIETLLADWPDCPDVTRLNLENERVALDVLQRERDRSRG